MAGKSGHEVVNSASIQEHSDAEKRFELLKFNGGRSAGKTGYRLSWWKNGRFMPCAPMFTEKELIGLLSIALKKEVLSDSTLSRMRKLLAQD
jgi:hypothetical protein